MNPDPRLTEEQIKLHNDLYARANELMKGLAILDNVPKKNLGFFEKRRLRQAIELHQQVLEINPANWSSMVMIGKAFQSLDELEQALKWFLQAHECVPDNPSVAKEVGYVAGRLGKHDIAIDAMRAVANLHPNNAGLYFNLGLSCLMAGKVADACRAFEHTIELEPERELNKKLLILAKNVEAGKCPCPKTEAEISRAIK
jgi:tetratricopeptide (TPR) repeat protein